MKLKRHQKPRVFLLADVPYDIVFDIMGMLQSYAKHKKRIIVAIASKNPVEIRIQEKVRASVTKVLKIDQEADMTKVVEEFTGAKLNQMESDV